MSITLSGISLSNTSLPLPIVDGGTGQTTAPTAINALLPSQTGVTSGWVLQTNGTNVSWVAPSGGGGVTISNVSTNATFYPTFTSATSGTLSTIDVSSTALTWNPGLYTLTGGNPAGSGGNFNIYTPNISSGSSVAPSSINIQPGTLSATGANTPGIVNISGGTDSVGTSGGGDVNINGGTTTGATPGTYYGDINLTAGTSTGTGAYQGSIYLTVGSAPTNVALQIQADTTGIQPGAWLVNGSAGTAGEVLVSGGAGVSPSWSGPNSPFIMFTTTTISGTTDLDTNTSGNATIMRSSSNITLNYQQTLDSVGTHNFFTINTPGYYQFVIRNQYHVTSPSEALETSASNFEALLYLASGTGFIDYPNSVSSPDTFYQNYYVVGSMDQFVTMVVYVSAAGAGLLIEFTSSGTEVWSTITINYIGS